MISNVVAALNAVVPTFLIIFAGFIIRRIGWTTQESLNIFNKIAFRLFLPCQLFKNVYESEVSGVDTKLVLFCLGGVLFMAVASLFFSIAAEPRVDRRGVICQAIFRGNFVLLGLPLAMSLFGDGSKGAVSMMIAFIIPFYNILAVIVLESYAKSKFNLMTVILGILKNPLIIATVLGALMRALKIQIYDFKIAETTLNFLAQPATTLCLFILGASFSPARISEHRRSLMYCVVGKLIVSPLIMVTTAVFLGFRGIRLGIILMIFATPTAVNSYSMAKEIGGDSDLAASNVVIGTGLSCITMFIWIFALKQLGFI